MALVLTFPGQKERPAATFIQRNEKMCAEISVYHINPRCTHFLLHSESQEGKEHAGGVLESNVPKEESLSDACRQEHSTKEAHLLIYTYILIKAASDVHEGPPSFCEGIPESDCAISRQNARLLYIKLTGVTFNGGGDRSTVPPMVKQGRTLLKS